MTTDKEQEAFGLVVQRQKSGASENDIPSRIPAFHGNSRRRCPSRDYHRRAGLGSATQAGWTSTSTNTCIEFKRDIVRNRLPVPDYIAQLDGYLVSLLKAGTGVRNGILTDGVHYFLRRVGEEKLPPATASSDEHLRPRRTGTPPAGIPARDRIGPSRRPQTHSRELGTPLRE